MYATSENLLLQYLNPNTIYFHPSDLSCNAKSTAEKVKQESQILKEHKKHKKQCNA